MTMRGNTPASGAGRAAVLLLAAAFGGLALGGCAALDLRQIVKTETANTGRTFAGAQTPDDAAPGGEQGEPGEQGEQSRPDQAGQALSRDAATLARKERQQSRVPPVLYPGSCRQRASRLSFSATRSA